MQILCKQNLVSITGHFHFYMFTFHTLRVICITIKYQPVSFLVELDGDDTSQVSVALECCINKLVKMEVLVSEVSYQLELKNCVFL